MSSQADRVQRFIIIASFGEWLSTLGFIFGGCCSNALALELITAQHTYAGTLITFAQFLIVTIFGLRKQLSIQPSSLNREDAFKYISSQLVKAQARKRVEPFNVALAGLDSSVSGIFAEEMATYLRGKSMNLQTIVKQHNTSLNQRESSELHNLNGLAPNAIVIQCYTARSLSEADLTADCDFAIYLHDASNSSSKFSKTSTSTPPYIIIDITNHSSPIILYPSQTSLLSKFLRIRLKRRHIPLSRYFVQVVLFLLVNLLNNAAFAYKVPMAVHIIFRSGGLVVNMVMGWLIEGRRYTKIQVFSVFLVTLGVALTTLSSMQSKPSRGSLKSSANSAGATSHEGAPSFITYFTGILVLSLALVLSGFLGLSQDKAFAQYGRGNWEEAMFYLHALALPMFAFVGPDLVAQIAAVNSGPQMELGLQTLIKPLQLLTVTGRGNQTVATATSSSSKLPPLPFLPVRLPTLRVPSFYIPLILNVFTQLVCVSGVNRLTSRVNSLTVALVLVVRKAVSLAISVLLLGGSKGNTLLWVGALAVLIGTVGYTLGGNIAKKEVKKE